LSNRHVPQAFYRAYGDRPAFPESTLPADQQEAGSEETGEPETGAVEEKQGFSDWLKDVIIPAFKVLPGLPRPLKAAVLVLACVILCAGGGYWLARADEIALSKADELYDGGKRSEAAAVYRQHPKQLLHPDGSGARYLRRLIEHDLEKGDRAEARSWVEKAVEADIRLEFNSPEAAALYKQAKDEQDRRVAQLRAEEEARRKAAEEDERRRREEQRRRGGRRPSAQGAGRPNSGPRRKTASAANERRRPMPNGGGKRTGTCATWRATTDERALRPSKGSWRLGTTRLQRHRTSSPAWDCALQDSDREVRREAYNAVVKFGGGPKAAVPALAEALKNRDATIRAHAAALLKGIGPDAAETTLALIGCLGDPKVRPEAIEALGRIGKPAVPALATALRGDDRTAQLGAVQALSRIGKDAAEAAPALIPLLADSEVGLEAVRALSLIGKSAVPDLLKALDHPNAENRRRAAMTLGHIGPDAQEAMQSSPHSHGRIRPQRCARRRTSLSVGLTPERGRRLFRRRGVMKVVRLQLGNHAARANRWCFPASGRRAARHPLSCPPWPVSSHRTRLVGHSDDA